jgi:hypothetical protein
VKPPPTDTQVVAGVRLLVLRARCWFVALLWAAGRDQEAHAELADLLDWLPVRDGNVS